MRTNLEVVVHEHAGVLNSIHRPSIATGPRTLANQTQFPHLPLF